MTESQASESIRTPSLADAFIPLVALAVLIAGSLALFGFDALDGPIQVALVLCCAVAALIALKNGHQWTAVQESGQAALSSITSALFILLAVGALIGTWNLSGTIPTLVYYGIQVLSPGMVLLGGGGHLRRRRAVDRQLVDHRRNDRRRSGRHRHHARGLRRRSPPARSSPGRTSATSSRRCRRRRS